MGEKIKEGGHNTEGSGLIISIWEMNKKKILHFLLWFYARENVKT